MKRTPSHIFLIGFSGSGKSTTGPLLARRLRARFVDTDSLIEQHFGKTIPDIFKEDGEPAFRKAESEIIGLLCNTSDKLVIGLGGGAIQNKANHLLIQKSGVVVYLQCAVLEIYRRLHHTASRPLLQVRVRKGETARQAVMNKIKSLLNKRKSQYCKADITISTTRRTPQEVVAEIVKRIRELYG